MATFLSTAEIEAAPSQSIQTPTTMEEYVENYFEDTPVMAKIAWCESRFTHFSTEGKGVMRGQVNNSDVGVMQINEYYHQKTADALGYDLHDLEDNMAYAKNLYEREGVQPWASSSDCWNKNGQIAKR